MSKSEINNTSFQCSGCCRVSLRFRKDIERIDAIAAGAETVREISKCIDSPLSPQTEQARYSSKSSPGSCSSSWPQNLREVSIFKSLHFSKLARTHMHRLAVALPTSTSSSASLERATSAIHCHFELPSITIRCTNPWACPQLLYCLVVIYNDHSCRPHRFSSK